VAKSSPFDVYEDEETAHRRDDALKRALSTPHKLHSEMKLGKSKKQATNPKTRPSSKGRVHKGRTKT
jgi:hypothetical protein